MHGWNTVQILCENTSSYSLYHTPLPPHPPESAATAGLNVTNSNSLSHNIAMLFCMWWKRSYSKINRLNFCWMSCIFDCMSLLHEVGSESDEVNASWKRYSRVDDITLVAEQYWTKRICALTRVTGLCTFSDHKWCLILKYATKMVTGNIYLHSYSPSKQPRCYSGAFSTLILARRTM